MSQNIFTKLQSEYGFLTRVEKQIADVLLRDPRQFMGLSMTQLSQQTGVSQGSITNFSKKFSPGGYGELKLQVASCLSTQEESAAVVEQCDNMRDAMNGVMNDSMVSFRNTQARNDEAVLQTVARRILDAKKVDIYGVAQSGISAQVFCYQLIQLGLPATFLSDMLMSAVSASMLDSDDLVIAISASGRTKEILDAVQIAKENGVPVVCLTSHRSSPLAKLADDLLLTVPGKLIDGSGDRVSQLFVIDVLCSYMRGIIDAGDKKRCVRLQEIMTSHSVND